MTAPASARPPRPDLPPARLRTAFGVAFVALGLFWMPWMLLRQVDAFLAFQTPAELGRDVALALLLLTLPALLLAALSIGVGRLLQRRGMPAARADVVAWAVTLLPLTWICVWQFGSASWAWLKLVTDGDFALSATARLLAVSGLLLVSLFALRGGRLKTFLARLVPPLRSLQKVAMALLVVSVGWLLVHPPRMTLLTPAPASAPRPAGSGAQPDVYLLTIDTLAAEDAAVCGDGPTTMPRLRALAARATCFDRHYASSNFTTPSTSTMETGALPWTHWGVQIVAKMAPAMRGQTLASQLRAQGYEAHSISANLMASPRHHGSFDEYTTQRISPSPSLGLQPRVALSTMADTTLPFWLSGLIPLLDTLDVHFFPERSPFAPAYTYDAALPLLQGTDRPKFFWLHTLPPHDPYLPPPSTKHKLLPAGQLDRWSEMLGMTRYAQRQQPLVDKHRLRYQESIMGADEALGRFLDELDRQGKLDNALVIVTSDHGESFERGYLGHAGDWLHEAVVRVPLVIKLPGQRTGRVVTTPVSLADLVPTVSDLLGLPPLPSAEGRSLKPALLGGELPPQPVFTMAMERQSRFRPIRAGHYAVIDGNFKLVLHAAEQRAELYDLAQDPREQRDLSAQLPDVAKRLRALLDARMADAERRRAAQFGG